MQVKIDTKERFRVITPKETTLSATMTVELSTMLLSYQKNKVKNVIIDLSCVDTADDAAVEQLLHIQRNFYENNASFFCCNLRQAVTAVLLKNEAAEFLNVVPTVSEAADMVQMEEIERELMDDDDITF